MEQPLSKLYFFPIKTKTVPFSKEIKDSTN